MQCDQKNMKSYLNGINRYCGGCNMMDRLNKLKMIMLYPEDICFGFIPKYHAFNIPIIDKMIFYLQCIMEDLLFDVTSKYHMTRMCVDNKQYYCDIWLYCTSAKEIRRNELPRILIRDRGNRYKPIRVEITPEARIIFPNRRKANKYVKCIEKIRGFVKENYDILLLHWVNDWDDLAILKYCIYILKKEMTQKEAFRRLLSDETIDEIPTFLVGK